MTSWRKKRIKSLFSERNERTDNGKESELLSVSEYYGVAYKREKTKSSKIISRADSLDGYKICKKNDLVINIMLAWKGALGISNYDGIVSPAYCVFTPKVNMDTRYFHYLFRTNYYKGIFKQHSKGIIDSRLRLYPQIFLALSCQVPPVTEQKKIANYLDEKTKEIDNAIEKTQNTIELYKEYKKSLITETVTKGLDPNTEMKDSGVEWIDKIPSDWTIEKLKNLFSFGKGLPITKANLVDDGVPVISYGQIHAKFNTGTKIVPNLFRFVDSEYLNSNFNSLVEKGDLIIADTSEDLDGCGNAVYVDKKMTLFAGYHTVILKHENETGNNKFFAYLILTDAWRSQIRQRVTSVKVYSITQKILKECSMILPPHSEQQKIVEFLDEQVAKIDQLIAEKQEIIEDLKTYKQSLIYEVVTGKKSVI